jgi:uncharacterized lipoprotein YmbA
LANECLAENHAKGCLPRSINQEFIKMPLRLQSLNYDSKQNRAMVVLIDDHGQMIQARFVMNTTGDETQNQVNDMMKAKAKQLFQEAETLL